MKQHLTFENVLCEAAVAPAERACTAAILGEPAGSGARSGVCNGSATVSGALTDQ